MSSYFVNLSDFMGLVAKKMQEKENLYFFLKLYGQGQLGEKMKNMIYQEEHMF